MIRLEKRRYWLDIHLSRRDKLIMGRYVRHPRGGIGVAAWTKKIEGITVRKRRKTKEEQNGLIKPLKNNVTELHPLTTFLIEWVYEKNCLKLLFILLVVLVCLPYSNCLECFLKKLV